MWEDLSSCGNGLSALRRRGLTAEVDDNLEIEFEDPQAIYAELCKLQNRYAFHGVTEFKKKIPTLFIDDKNMGPLNNLKVQEIQALAEPSPFGRGSKTVYDENVRKATEIKASRMRLEMIYPREIQNLAPIGHKIVPRLYKLAIYEKDGFFAEHSDTVHAGNHIGTLVMCLPVPHKGGTFILSDDGNELKLPFDKMIKDKQVPWVAFYTDVKHKVEMVQSGVRMTLQFDLMTELEDDDEDGIYKTLMGKHRNFNQNYRFHDYSEEVLEKIKNKIALTLGQEIKKPKEKKDGQKDKPDKPGSKNVLKKRDRPDDDKPLILEIKTAKQMKVEESESEAETNEDEDDEDQSASFEKKLKVSDSKSRERNPDCVAILLKRRYGPITLSLDRLKGCDEVLYHTLKDDFKVEVKNILLEQSVDYDGGGPIEIMALDKITGKVKQEKESVCSSDGEGVGLDPEHKKVPSTPAEQKKRVQVSSKKIVKKGKKSIEKDEEKKEEKKGGKGKKKEDEEDVKTVYMVSGFSPKALEELVSEEYVEYTGNEDQAGVYAYMHAAMFVYPKGK